jgi:hypothetical protein
MNQFIDKRLKKISDELSSSERKRLHARIEIDNRDELLREAAEIIRRLTERLSCECAPPCLIEGISWASCEQYKDCLKSNECMPCLHCESKQILKQIDDMTSALGDWFSDPLAEKLLKQLHETYDEESSDDDR